MRLQLITPEKILFDGDVEMVTIPGAEGEFGVLSGHAPFVSTLREGEIVIDIARGEQKKIPVKDGIAEVTPDKCTVLIEAA
jgi:F-type H+-transporting ATPase subunit epsilon